VPLRLIHVVRNPFDNIAAISIRHGLSLEESVEFYFSHCVTTAGLDALSDPSRSITIRHEAMISDPRADLSRLCAFLDLELYPGYLEDCCRVVFTSPTFTRRKVSWSPALVRDVETRARAFSFLDGYEFELRSEDDTS
jgi:hypothetical protein